VPTIIDTLVVELGLDASKFTKAQKEAVANFNKSQEELIKHGKAVEHQGRMLLDVYSKVRNQILGVMAAFTAGMGIAGFIQYNAKMTAGIGRMAEVVHMSKEGLASWQGLARQVGETAENAGGAILGFTQSLEGFAMTGEASQAVTGLRSLGIVLTEISDDGKPKWKDTTKVLLELSAAINKMPAGEAYNRISKMGLTPLFDVLRKGPTEINRLMGEQKKLGVPTDEDIKAAEEFQKVWAEVTQESMSAGRAIFTLLAPAILKVLGYVKELVAEWLPHKDDMTGVFIAMGVAAAALLTPLGSVLSVLLSIMAAMMANPIGLAILGLGAAAGGAYLAYRNWDSIKKWWTDWFTGASGSTPAAPSAAAPGKAAGSKTSSPKLSSGSSTSDVEAFMKMGWSREHAIGLAANIQAESSGNPGSMGFDNSGRFYGLAQWDPNRQADFAKWAGHSIRGSSRDEQLAFINYELRQGKERKAYASIMATRDAQKASYAVARDYERTDHLEREGRKRAAIAGSISGRMGAMGSAPAAVRGGAGRVSQVHKETNIGTVNVNAGHATDAEGISKKLSSALERNLFAQQANFGQA
jgi:hypothetical protein